MSSGTWLYAVGVISRTGWNLCRAPSAGAVMEDAERSLRHGSYLVIYTPPSCYRTSETDPSDGLVVTMSELLRSYESPVRENQSQFSASLSGMILHLNAQDQEMHARVRQLEDSVKELLQAPLKRSEPSSEDMQKLVNQALHATGPEEPFSDLVTSGETVESVELLRKQAPT